jgi:hypothetical protein
VDWCALQTVEDLKEQDETIDSVVKSLNMRLRPETSPELDKLRKDKHSSAVSEEQFEKLVAQGPRMASD